MKKKQREIKPASRNMLTARKIARQLFTCGTGVTADHLRLVRREKYLGGWCERAAADQICKVLDQESKVQP